MAGAMTARMVRDLGEFVAALEKLAKEHNVEVCAYGPIDLRVEDYNDHEAFVRLERDEHDDAYVIRETRP